MTGRGAARRGGGGWALRPHRAGCVSRHRRRPGPPPRVSPASVRAAASAAVEARGYQARGKREERTAREREAEVEFPRPVAELEHSLAGWQEHAEEGAVDDDRCQARAVPGDAPARPARVAFHAPVPASRRDVEAGAAAGVGEEPYRTAASLALPQRS